MNAKVASRPRMSSEERKACIVQAALRLFSEKGFRGVTTRELAAAVGVTEPVLYEHFRTKRDLYAAIIEEKSNDALQVVSDISDRFTASGDDHAFFVSLAESIVNWYTQDPAFIRLLLFSNLEGHELKDLLHERSFGCFRIVSGYIARRVSEGAFRDVDPLVAARAFFGMVAHYAMTAVVFNAPFIPRPPLEVVREMVGIFMSGLCKQDQTR